MVFKSRSRSGKRDRTILSVLMVFIGTTIIFANNAPDKILYYITALDMIILYGCIYYLIRSLDRLKLEFKNRVLLIKHGFTEIAIPYSQMIKVERVGHANWKKIMAMEWREHYVGYYRELKHGLVRAFAASKDNLILIHTRNGKYVLTPEDNHAFLEEINKRWDKKSSPAQSEKTSLAPTRVWSSTAGKLMLLVNILLLLIPAALLLLLAGNHTVASLFNTVVPGLTATLGFSWEPVFLLISGLAVFVYIAYEADLLSRNGIDHSSIFLWVSAVFTLMISAIMAAMVF